MKLLYPLYSVILLCMAGCATQPQYSAGGLTPRAGFNGRSEGIGTLKLLFGDKRPYHVDNHGYPVREGVFRLDQTVKFEGEPAQRRFWIIRTVAPGRYEGTLSDAAGTVSGHTNDATLALDYRVKGPLIMHQTLTLMADGRSLDNVGTITFLGIPVGHLREVIRRKHSPDK